MTKRFWSKRSTYAVAGWAIGMAIGLVAFYGWKKATVLLTLPPLLGMIFALWWGERAGQIPSVDEAHQPITLFDKDPSSNPSGRPPTS
jgi:hypothetical protein